MTLCSERIISEAKIGVISFLLRFEKLEFQKVLIAGVCARDWATVAGLFDFVEKMPASPCLSVAVADRPSHAASTASQCRGWRIRSFTEIPVPTFHVTETTRPSFEMDSCFSYTLNQERAECMSLGRGA
jgi:hypothetical protein